MKDIVRIHASSGTTGKPKIVGYTRNDLDLWGECVARGMTMAGASQESVVHVSYGYGLFTGGMGAHLGAETIGATVIPMSSGNTQKQITFLQDMKSDILLLHTVLCTDYRGRCEEGWDQTGRTESFCRNIRRRAVDAEHARQDRRGSGYPRV